MIIPNQIVKIKWSNTNKSFYEEKGYTFTKIGKEFDVKVEDLALGSHATIKVKCDYCGSTYSADFRSILKGRKNILKDSCKKCVGCKCADITIKKR